MTNHRHIISAPPAYWRSWTRRLSIALLLVLNAGCAPEVISPQRLGGLERVGELKEALALFRGLKFTAEVPILLEKREAIKKVLEAGLFPDYGKQELADISLAYAKLGLFPPGTDLRTSLSKFYGDRGLGFYDPRAGRVVLTSERKTRIPSENAFDEAVLLHELTHALQDQNFSMRARLSRSDNDDKDLALRSIAEGDAVLTELTYLFRYVQGSSGKIQETIDRNSTQLHSTLSGVPVALVNKLLFLYQRGPSFVYQVFNEKGWSGVDVLYSSPPVSTEQVLHPAKYLQSPDLPTRVEFKDLSGLFPSGWDKIQNNTLGELMVQSLFNGFFSQQEAAAAASGWDGDRFVAFRRGGEISFIWATVWDSSRHAEKFLRNYQAILSRKYSSDMLDTHAYIEHRDQRVVVVEGLSRAHVKSHIDKVWQEMELREALPGPAVFR
ncbi:MAG: hypothetical protein HY695_19485 [Deltaproteobacteria bacterium]|nr:hypothetical protein [Deltaproteobacteria bacterium]